MGFFIFLSYTFATKPSANFQHCGESFGTRTSILFVCSINHFAIKAGAGMVYIGNVSDKWHIDFDAFE